MEVSTMSLLERAVETHQRIEEESEAIRRQKQQEREEQRRQLEQLAFEGAVTLCAYRFGVAKIDLGEDGVRLEHFNAAYGEGGRDGLVILGFDEPDLYLAVHLHHLYSRNFNMDNEAQRNRCTVKTVKPLSLIPERRWLSGYQHTSSDLDNIAALGKVVAYLRRDREREEMGVDVDAG